MTVSNNGHSVLSCRRALEALRNGVPNREAVQLLGCTQPLAEREFQDLLRRASDTNEPPAGSQGMLVSGDFGTGKSHLLSHFEHRALSQGFVCSKVAISKETPLYDLGKVFKSAMDNGRILDHTGPLIEEIGQKLNPNIDGYAALFRWANSSSSGVHPIFPASLLVHERSNELELNRTIESFWAGDRIKVSDVKNGLKQIGQSQSYSFRAPRATDLPPQRLRFATELIKGAGYRGWVVLLDEIELVGQYSLLQRARSYAELARWLGQASGESCPGLVVVGTVTTDYALANISPEASSKKDRDYAGQRLRARGDDGGAARAETAMRLLERECTPLSTPEEADVNDTLNTLRYIYSKAYGWDAPVLETRGAVAGYQQRMRYRIRSAINEWDLLRLYPDSSPETEGREFSHRYVEISDLETQSKDDESEAE